MFDLTSVLAVLADHRGDDHGWWWPIFPLLWIALIGFAIWTFSRRRRRDPLDGARGVLAERYARGDISLDEYRERLAQLG